MIKLIAMIISYRWGMRVLMDAIKRGDVPRVLSPHQVFRDSYSWMFYTLTKPIGEMK